LSSILYDFSIDLLKTLNPGHARRTEAMAGVGRAEAFVLSVTAAFLAPAAVPNVGIDYTYFFIMVLVLFAWFTLKWTTVKSLAVRSGLVEMVLGSAAIAAVYGYKILSQTRLGLLDMLIIFGALVLAFYGVKSFKLFWVPTTYGIALLVGYQVEAVTPNFVQLQDWMAGIMASSMHMLGISATLSGQYVTLNSSSGPLLLNVESDCTGIQGIIAFGLLSTMSVLDLKAKPARLAVVFAVGFLGAFLINIVRLIGVFLAFQFLGPAIGDQVHVYFGYTLFIAWVLMFWSVAFKYLTPRQSRPLLASASVPPTGTKKAATRPQVVLSPLAPPCSQSWQFRESVRPSAQIKESFQLNRLGWKTVS
jgi:exosortase/archaeosortase family protein